MIIIIIIIINKVGGFIKNIQHETFQNKIDSWKSKMAKIERNVVLVSLLLTLKRSHALFWFTIYFEHVLICWVTFPSSGDNCFVKCSFYIAKCARSLIVIRFNTFNTTTFDLFNAT